MKQLFFILSAFFVLNGCQRENEFFETESNVEQPQVTVFSSMVGLISDDSGNFVSGATVSLGEYETSTNDFGVFEFQDILIPEDAAYVQVYKAGYFNGSRSFSTELNETPYVRIELLAKEFVDYVNADAGGLVEFGNSKVDLPGGEYQLQDGTIHTGEIFVFASYLDPTKRETFQQMPGQLSGINTEGEIKALESYGMIGVELTSSSGEYLTLPVGEEAEIRMEVPASLLASAPSTIPLWHFDEVKGTWVEEGQASLIGNQYVGKVSHFSFWNCDEPFDFVELSGLVQIQGEPFLGADIKITDLASGTCRFGVSGERGFFTGKVPKGRNLLLEVLDLCGEVIFELALGELTDDLEDVIIEVTDGISSGVELVSVSGYLDNCGAGDIEEGYVIISGAEINVIIPVDADGTFSAEFPACSTFTLVEVYGFDEGNELLSFPEIGVLTELDGLYLFTCEDFENNSGYEIYYEGQNWNPIGNEEVFLVPEIDSSGGIGFVLSYTIIDLEVYDPLEGPQCVASFFISANLDEVEYELVFESQGFSISGVCEKSTEQVGPFEVCLFQDETDNIHVFDSEKYPGDVPEVSFIIRF